MQERDYLTTAEICDYLRLKERTIYDLVARRAIPCSRATGKLLFPRRLVDRWVEAHVEMQDRSAAEPPPIVAGSSDPLLEWALRESGSSLASLFEGSQAGLQRFARGEVLAVGLHLRDSDGGYNREAVRTLAGAADLLLLQWAWREQGFLVRSGNPLKLQSVADLATKAPRLVLRQRGSGSDTLLQALLADAGLAAADLNIAGRVALTETDVAIAVADGAADCGMAVGAVARRFGLDFVPLARERFDLALRRRSFFEPPLQRLFAFARTEAFRQRTEALGHIDVSGTGTVELNA